MRGVLHAGRGTGEPGGARVRRAGRGVRARGRRALHVRRVARQRRRRDRRRWQRRRELGLHPWGARVAATGQETGYGYAGERQDPATGLVFLRPRWYAPSTGRFLTPDRYGAESRDPRTLHRYAYALDNPLNRTDPTGQQSLCELNIFETSTTPSRASRTPSRCASRRTSRVRFTRPSPPGRRTRWSTRSSTSSASSSRRSARSHGRVQLLEGVRLPFEPRGHPLQRRWRPRLVRRPLRVRGVARLELRQAPRAQQDARRPGEHPWDPIGAYSDCFSGLVNHTGSTSSSASCSASSSAHVEDLQGQAARALLPLRRALRASCLPLRVRHDAAAGGERRRRPACAGTAGRRRATTWPARASSRKTQTTIGSVYVAFGLNANAEDPEHRRVYVPNLSACKKN